jgi:flagellin
MALTHEWNGFKILAGKADGITDVDKDGTIELTDPDDATIKGPEAAGQNKLGLTLKFQVGDSSEQAIEVELPNFTQDGTVTRAIFFSDFNPASPDSASEPTTIANVEGAQKVIALCKMALDKVSESRSMMGAVMNRLEHVVDNLTNVSMNSSASRSQIEDADYALASTELAKSQIMQQAATAVLAQANTSQQTVLKLLG